MLRTAFKAGLSIGFSLPALAVILLLVWDWRWRRARTKLAQANSRRLQNARADENVVPSTEKEVCHELASPIAELLGQSRSEADLRAQIHEMA